MEPFQTKPGRHGTMYRYLLKYKDESGDGPTFATTRWAYSEEHARELFMDPDDPHWTLVEVSKMRHPSY